MSAEAQHNTFAPRIDLATGLNPLGVAIVDLDDDGLQDLVVSIHEEDVLALYRQVRGRGPVSFAPAVEVPAGLHPQELVVADFDGDDLPDVAVADSGRGGGGTLSVYRNTSTPGTVSLAPRVDYTADTARRLAFGDLDLDGKLDIVVSSNSPRQFLVFRNTSTVGSLSFSHDLTLATADHPNIVQIVDLDGDGLRDIAAAIDKADVLSVYPNTTAAPGGISFGTRLDFDAGSDPDGPVVAQLDGQGNPDVVVTNIFSDSLSLLINESTPGSFAFAAPQTFPATTQPREPGLGDFNGDGVSEIVVKNFDDSFAVFQVVSDAGEVSLEVVTERATGPAPSLSTVGDLDGDGAVDLVVAAHHGESVGIFLNTRNTPLILDHLLLCEVASNPSAAELIEIVNPTAETIDLSNHYLSDDQDYALLPGFSGAGPAPTISAFDFIVRFPEGTMMAPGEVLVVAMDGAAFTSYFGVAPDFEIHGTDPAVPDLVPVDLGSSAGLTDSGEHVTLFTWDGASDLVADVDIVRVGRPTLGGSNDLADKTSIAVDGPDGDTDPSLYFADAFTMPLASADPGSGESVKRSLLEGPDETALNGNGITGHDETSENILVTWDSELRYTPADPGVCCLTLPCLYASVNPTDASTLRATLHPVIDDHLRWSYDNIWEILEMADEDPLDLSQIVDVYKNSPYPKDRVSYEREHTWPKSYGFPTDLVSNYPFTDAHHLFLADGSYNGSRSNKPYRACGAGCSEKVTVLYDGRGGGSGVYPGQSNWTEGANTSGTWETWMGRRGDVARALFYLELRYEGGFHGVTGVLEPNLHLTDDETLIAQWNTGSNEDTGYMGILSDLLAWHDEDPVDHRELWRNAVIERYQRNRNPFVDHPEWVHCLYDNVCPGVDLTVDKDDFWPDAVVGETVTYTLEIDNLGPDAVAGAVVQDLFDADRVDVAAVVWTCAPALGAGSGTTCPASGTAAELEAGVEVDIAAGEAVIFTVDTPVVLTATGTLVNTATAGAPVGIFERFPASNTDSDTNDLPPLGACGQPDERVLTDTTVTGVEVAEACTSITAHSGFHVDGTGDVTLRAGERVALGDGFSVGTGGRLVLEVGGL